MKPSKTIGMTAACSLALGLLVALGLLFGQAKTGKAANIASPSGPAAEIILPHTLTIEPDYTAVSLGQVFTVNVVISDIVDLGGFEYVLEFSPSVVLAARAQLGDFPTSTGRIVIELGPLINNTVGTVNHAFFSFGAQPGPDGRGIIASVAFTATGYGTSPLDLTAAEATDTAGDVLTPTILIDGMVTVPCTDVTGVELTLLTTGDVYTDTSVEFSADIVPDDATKPYGYSIDFGDGTSLEEGNSIDDPLAFDHTFVNPGTYNVEIGVWDCDMTEPLTDTVAVPVAVEETILISFNSASYSAGEGEGAATISVTLDAAPSLPVTVDYATSDNTAIAGSDYVAVNGVLSFTAGVTIQTFAVSILDDTLGESDETIALMLSNPTNGTLGVPDAATLTILDDDRSFVYLPLILSGWPTIPHAPVLIPISNPDRDGSYTVEWGVAALAQSYILESATNATFTDASVVYQGTGTSHLVNNQSAGTYYYRVKATNNWGESGWSNDQSVVVGPPDAPVLSPISNSDGDGDYAVSWNAATGATSYTLEEDDSAAFSSPTTVYSGSGLTWNATGKAEGTYHYRVEASNSAGDSGWSNEETVTVMEEPSPYDWTRVSTSVTNTLLAVHFIDNQTGWVLASDGKVLHTMDGGQSWDIQETMSPKSGIDVFFVDENKGWIVGTDALILRTTDGGNTWQPQSSPVSEDYTFWTIQFVDAEHGWIAARKIWFDPNPPINQRFYGHVLRTTDGGESWHSADYFSTHSVDDLYFIDENEGWYLSTTFDAAWIDWWKAVYHTTTGGTSWGRQSSSLTETDLNDIFFVDSNTGWLVGDDKWSDGPVWRTTDGSTWRDANIGIDDDLFGVQFVGSSNGWIRSRGSIWHTADGGDVWNAQTIESSCTDFNDFHFVDTGHGYVVGDNGVVCKYD